MSRRISQSKIAFNPWLREAAQARARLIKQAKADGDWGFLRYLRRQEAEERREVQLSKIPPRIRRRWWFAPAHSFRGRPYTRHHLSGGEEEDSDAAR